eukprot:tig00000545_g1977.t1
MPRPTGIGTARRRPGAAQRAAFLSGLAREEAGRGGAGADEPAAPASRRLFGAVLLADIVGAAAGGGRGRGPGAGRRARAELLSRRLNAALRDIVGVARAWDADVLRFLGDAVLLLVPCAGRAELPGACRRALGVASALLRPREPSDEVPEPFQLHVAVAAGRLAALRLGGVGGKLELVVHGRPLERIARGIGLAGPGAVLAAVGATPQPEPRTRPGSRGAEGYAVLEGGSPVLAAALEGGEGPASFASPLSPISGPGLPSMPLSPGPPAAVTAAASLLPLSGPEAPSPSPAPDGGTGPDDASLRPFVPRDVEWVLENGGRFLTELRLITVAFVLVAPPRAAPGEDSAREDDPLDPEALRTMQRRVCVVQEEAGRARGIVRAFFRDDKPKSLRRPPGFVGLVTFGLAGAPGGGGADDPLRAASFAVHVRDAFGAEELGPVSVGLATGRVFCGLVGDERPGGRCDYTVLGDSVNLAARLMALAGGAVWADRATQEALGTAYATEELPPLAIKGYEGFTRAFAVLRRSRSDNSLGRRARSLLQLSGRSGSRRSLASAGSTSGALLATPQGADTDAEGPPADGAPTSAADRDRHVHSANASVSAVSAVSSHLTEDAADEGGGGVRPFGRRPQLLAIREFLAKAKAEEGPGVLILEGEAGSGKSVLLCEALRLAEAARVPAVMVSGDPLEAAPPLHALRSALRLVIRGGGPRPDLAAPDDEVAPAAEPPLSVRRFVPQQRAAGKIPSLQLLDFEEPSEEPSQAQDQAPAHGQGRSARPKETPGGPGPAALPEEDGAEDGVRPAEGTASTGELEGGRRASEAPEDFSEFAVTARLSASSSRRSFQWTVEPAAGGDPSARDELAAGRLQSILHRIDARLATPTNAHLLKALLEEPRSNSPRPAASGGAAAEAGPDADAMLAFAGALLLAVMRRLGAVLVVDDAAHLDSGSLTLLASLAEAPGSSLLLACQAAPAPAPASSSSLASGPHHPGPGTPTPSNAPAPRSLEPFRGCPRTRVLPLPPLSPTETRAFIGHLVDVAVDAVPPWLASELAEQSRGNALVIQEMLAHLRAEHVVARMPDGALVVFDEGGATLPFSQSRAALPVPVSLERLVVSRLDRITPDAALCCKLLAVLGTRFEAPLALAALAADLDPATVLRALAILEASGVLARDDTGRGTPEYRFASAATAGVLYRLLAESDRRRVHWRAAMELEARPNASAAALAHHCTRAGAVLAAVGYLDRAAAEALGAGAYAEALYFSKKASIPEISPPISPHFPERPAAGRWGTAQAAELAAASARGGGPDAPPPGTAWRPCAAPAPRRGAPSPAPPRRPPGATSPPPAPSSPSATSPRPPGRASLEDALGLLGIPLAKDVSNLLGAGGSLLKLIMAGPARVPPSGRTAPRAEDTADALHRKTAAEALNLYSHILVHRGDALGSAYYSVRNVLIANRDPASPEYAEACAFVYSLLGRMGMLRKGKMFLDRAREISRLPGCGGALGYILSNQVTMLTLLGRLQAAEEMGVRGAVELASAGDLRAAFEASMNHAAAAVFRGRFSAADEACLTVIEDSRMGANHLRLHWSLVSWAFSCILRGWPRPGGSPPGGLSVHSPEPRYSLADVQRAVEEARRLPLDPSAAMDRMVSAAAAACVAALAARPAEAIGAALESLRWLERHRRVRLAGRVLVYQLVLLPLFLLGDVLASLLREPEAIEPTTRAALWEGLRSVVHALEAGERPYPLVRAAALLQRGRWHALCGACAKAARCWREAARLSAAMGAAYFEARAYAHLAACPSCDERERRMALGHASWLLGSMSAHPPALADAPPPCP